MYNKNTIRSDGYGQEPIFLPGKALIFGILFRCVRLLRCAMMFSITSFAIHEYSMSMLKGQDTVILLKLAEYSEVQYSYAALGVDLCMSPSEVHAGVSRLALSGLVEAETRRVKTASALEFLKHGLKYVFPLERKA